MSRTINNHVTDFRTGHVEPMTAWLNRGLEALWLLAVVLVPIVYLDRDVVSSEAVIAYVELPKVALLRVLVAVMAVLWLVKWGIEGGHTISRIVTRLEVVWRPKYIIGRFITWLNQQPANWLVLAVWIFLVITLLSTFLSASFNVSAWGEVPGQDGYSAYTLVSYVVLFGVIATHLRTQSQLRHLLVSVALMGTVVGGYAIFQHYGRDFLALTEQTGGGIAETTSFMGNSIFAGTTLMMSIPLSFVAAVTFQVPSRFATIV